MLNDSNTNDQANTNANEPVKVNPNDNANNNTDETYEVQCHDNNNHKKGDLIRLMSQFSCRQITSNVEVISHCSVNSSRTIRFRLKNLRICCLFFESTTSRFTLFDVAM